MQLKLQALAGAYMVCQEEKEKERTYSKTNKDLRIDIIHNSKVCG